MRGGSGTAVGRSWPRPERLQFRACARLAPGLSPPAAHHLPLRGPRPAGHQPAQFAEGLHLFEQPAA